jgi:hypothetical protein
MIVLTNWEIKPMEGRYYLMRWRIAKCVAVTSEAELYRVDTGYSGETVLGFGDGTMRFERDCFELSWSSFSVYLWMRWHTLRNTFKVHNDEQNPFEL